MKTILKGMLALMLLQSTLTASHAAPNAKAKADLDVGVAKAKQGDALFTQKKWGEAADTYNAAVQSIVRAVKRDPNVDGDGTLVKQTDFPSAFIYGYVDSQANSQNVQPGGNALTLESTYLIRVINEMWYDAAILAGRRVVPEQFGDEGLTKEISDESAMGLFEKAAEAIHKVDLPVRDDQLLGTVKTLKRALMKLDALKADNPKLSGTKDRHFSADGNAEMAPEEAAKIGHAKLKEVAPELEQVAADFAKADPVGLADSISRDVQALNEIIADVKREGYMGWTVMRELYVTKDYMSDRRKMYLTEFYAKEAKTMPANKLKPIEDKVKELKNAVESNAPRWSFPPGKTHNAAIESHVATIIKNSVPGATIVKNALGTPSWNIDKDEDTGLPKSRTRSVLTLLKKPGEKWAWLVIGFYSQDYAGGGTYNDGGSYSFNSVRFQMAR